MGEEQGPVKVCFWQEMAGSTSSWCEGGLDIIGHYALPLLQFERLDLFHEVLSVFNMVQGLAYQ